MQLPLNNAAELIRELARRASASKETSLFSLLLQREQQIRGAALHTEVRTLNSKASTTSHQRSPILVTHSRYIE